MGKVVIQAENISKKYRLGILNSGSLKQDIHAYWKTMFSSSVANSNPEEFSSTNDIWALKKISFKIVEGESIGFIGKNGAGKSTLLKILSRITLPTTGRIRGIGRVASLLEVGTGFHPELTGRENIFLNGQILGMKKREIIQKFDEIVAFSGIDRFIDTPVKRYSTGMYLRLSFAVAAHLDADILIVDEALAVGDAEFQAKCLEKMKEVTTRDGKTVLFVSHNLQVVRNLCQRAIYLHKGEMVDDGKPDRIIENYLHREKIHFLEQHYDSPENAPGNQYIRIKKTEIVPRSGSAKSIDITSALDIHFEFWQFTTSDLTVGLHVYDFSGTCIFDLQSDASVFSPGLIVGKSTIPAFFLNPGSYYLSIDFIKDNKERLYFFEVCLSFDIQSNIIQSKGFEQWSGYVKPDIPVLVEQINVKNQDE